MAVTSLEGGIPSLLCGCGTEAFTVFIRSLVLFSLPQCDENQRESAGREPAAPRGCIAFHGLLWNSRGLESHILAWLLTSPLTPARDLIATPEPMDTGVAMPSVVLQQL